MKTILGLLAAVVSLSAFANDPVWVELAPGGRVLARTVADACPQIALDGKVSTMSARLGAGAKGPPPGQRLVCEADVTGTRKASIGSVALPLPAGTPQRIVVLGDTGCRIKVAAAGGDDEGGDAKVQDCNDLRHWPFKTVAQSAADSRPDLVIHVGDYLYRESDCPADRKQDCGGSPHGDNWQAWNADFFDYARPLLEAAPWIFVRGNHESCKRAGRGWTYYLDPSAYAADNACADNTAPYEVAVGSFEAWVMDTAGADDADSQPDQVALFADEFIAAGKAGLSHGWLLSHRPLWAVKSGPKGERDRLVTLNATLQAAWAKAPAAGVDFIVSGHTHLFELMSFEQKLPPQAVIGIGGTSLAHAIKTKLKGQRFGGATVAHGDTADDFGYALIEPKDPPGNWKLELHDSAGNKRTSCTIGAYSASCG